MFEKETVIILDYGFLKPINNEEDLLIYENKLNGLKLNSQVKNKSKSIKCNEEISLCDYIKNHIGKTVRIEYNNGQKYQNILGILFSVGDNYIVLKYKSNYCTTVIPLTAILKMNILHKST